MARDVRLALCQRHHASVARRYGHRVSKRKVSGVLIRHADASRDAEACAAIYEPFVQYSVASLEERPPGRQALAERIERITPRYPWLVATLDDAEVIGYAYASQHRDRAAYRWAADVAIYVGSSHHRRGVGRALYGALLPLLDRQGLHIACAGITLPNEASVALHEGFGFKPVGIYRRIGWKAGAWRDVGWWELELRAPDPGITPAEPGAPPRLDDP
jgi:L-amino acid N-acyltransferase YncA